MNGMPDEVGDHHSALSKLTAKGLKDAIRQASQFGVVDMSQVDVVLVSNFTTMLALPYLTQYTNFHGKVYATEPTLQIGRMYMEEMVNYVERNPRMKPASLWKEEEYASVVPPSLREVTEPLGWRKLYTKHDIDACLSKVQTVGFNEKLTPLAMPDPMIGEFCVNAGEMKHFLID
nr:hypothetical protein BaRGS_000338 [Batillaria attramentaria]